MSRRKSKGKGKSRKESPATISARSTLRRAFLSGKGGNCRYMLVVFDKNPGNILTVYCEESDLDNAIARHREGGGVFEIYDLKSPLPPQLLQRRAWNVAPVRSKATRSV